MSELRQEWSESALAGHKEERASAPARTNDIAANRALQRVGIVAWRMVPIGLYLVTLGLLLFRLDSHPNFTYNWEDNTANGLFNFVEHPSLRIFHLTEGLMTDSGVSPLVVLPAWLGFMLGGASLGSMRWPVALLAATAVPLLWLVGKRLVGKRTALLAALFMALSPVFLLYARTATDVGISLVPMLLTTYVLLRILDKPERWQWVLALQGTLLVGAYGYAPVRFLWPFCIGLMILEAILHTEVRKRLLLAAGFTFIVIAFAITALDYEHDHNPVISVGYYYAGRGEQVANLLASEQDYARAVGQGDSQLLPTAQYLGEMIGQNSANLINLLLDRGTQSALTDYWNPHGRLIPLLLVPFFLIGLGTAAWRARKRDAYKYRLMVLFFAGFTLPMILTSQVHIGRLIFAVSLLCLLIALGMAQCGLAFDRVLRTVWESWRSRAKVRVGAAVALVLLTAWSTWRDYSVDVPPTREARITQQLIKDVGSVRAAGAQVALIEMDDPTLVLENIDANQFRLGLKDYYCFQNLTTGQSGPCGVRMPELLVGNLMNKIETPSTVPGYCTNIYYVSRDLIARFKAAIAGHPGLCPQPIEYRQLTD